MLLWAWSKKEVGEKNQWSQNCKQAIKRKVPAAVQLISLSRITPLTHTRTHTHTHASTHTHTHTHTHRHTHAHAHTHTRTHTQTHTHTHAHAHTHTRTHTHAHTRTQSHMHTHTDTHTHTQTHTRMHEKISEPPGSYKSILELLMNSSAGYRHTLILLYILKTEYILKAAKVSETTVKICILHLVMYLTWSYIMI